MFQIPSYDDCGIDLGCNYIDCRKKCLNSIRNLLGKNENFINVQARNRVCELVSPNNEAKNKIYVWASWMYSKCNSGNELLIEDLCCNPKCKCSIVSQTVSSDLNQSFQSLIVDKTNELPNRDKSFECSIRLQDECVNSCMNLISKYLNEPMIENPSSNILNYNIFFNQFASNTVCSALNREINKPGTDIYVKIDTKENNNLIKYISMGRICCRSQCTCEILFKDGANGTIPNNITFPLNTTFNNLGYECSDELANCISLCRQKGIEIAVNSQLLDGVVINQNQTSLDLDILNISCKSQYR